MAALERVDKAMDYIDRHTNETTKAEKKCDEPAPAKKRKLNQTNSSSSSKQDSSNLIWIDCEMTGLDTSIHHICEIAVLVTDKDLNIIAEGPDIVINLSDQQLCQMSEWCVEHHGKSGLTKQIKESQIDMSTAEDKVLEFMKEYVPKKTAPLCGNSIHADKKFLCIDMPKVNEYLHYRIIDVSTIKELCRRWYPKILKKAPKKKCTHRALDDIKESIEELKYYKSHIFVPMA